MPFAFQYLGDMERVSGVQFLEPNKCYRLPIFFHDSIIFPGETLPMILTQQMFVSTEFSDDGLLFGLVFNGLRNERNNDLYGVTCQIYEKGSDGINNVSIKSKAYQRFRINNDKYSSVDASSGQLLTRSPSAFVRRDNPQFYVVNNIRHEDVVILPEIVLPHPILGSQTNSFSKLRLNASMRTKLLKYESASMSWPPFVYELYNVERVIEQIKYFLSTLKIGNCTSGTSLNPT